MTNVNMKFQSHPVIHPTLINSVNCVIEIGFITENGFETVENVMKKVIKKIQTNPATYSKLPKPTNNLNQKLLNLKNV